MLRPVGPEGISCTLVRHKLVGRFRLFFWLLALPTVRSGTTSVLGIDRPPLEPTKLAQLRADLARVAIDSLQEWSSRKFALPTNPPNAMNTLELCGIFEETMAAGGVPAALVLLQREGYHEAANARLKHLGMAASWRIDLTECRDQGVAYTWRRGNTSTCAFPAVGKGLVERSPYVLSSLFWLRHLFGAFLGERLPLSGVRELLHFMDTAWARGERYELTGMALMHGAQWQAVVNLAGPEWPTSWVNEFCTAKMQVLAPFRCPAKK